MNSGTRVVTQPDSVVLDALEFVGLGDQFGFHNLTTSLLDLLQFLQVVPELGFGHNFVGGEKTHAVQLRIGVLGGGQGSTHNSVCAQLFACVGGKKKT